MILISIILLPQALTKEKMLSVYHFLILWFEGCPGSGCSWILIWATLPASKDAENPSKMVLLVLLLAKMAAIALMAVFTGLSLMVIIDNGRGGND